MKNVDDAYPLTPSQLGILYDSLRDEDPELYFEQVRFDVVGAIELAEMLVAWRETIARHPPLRTIWLWEGLDQPVQVVRTTADLPWTVLDWSDRDAAEIRSDLDDLAHADRQAGFDLGRAPVMRVVVVRLSNERVHVVWSYHHIMMDGWSTSLVIDEVLDRLAGLDPSDRRRNDPPTFRRYVEWLSTQDAERAERFWRDQLRTFPHATRLAGDRGTSARGFEAGRHTAALSVAESARLASTARRRRVTLNTLVQAAWAVVLSCNSGDDDVVFGVTTSGRPSELEGMEQIVGMFLATLPMRVRFDPSGTVLDLWTDVQALQLDLDQHRSSSLADITRWSDVQPGRSLFDSTLIFENFPRREGSERGFSVEHRSVREQTRFPMTLMVGLAEQLEMSALYDLSRFPGDAVDLLLRQLSGVLVRMADDPESTLAHLSVMSDEERHRVLVEWNATDRPIPDGTVHGAVDRRALACPDAVAVIADDTSISYGELRRRSDRLARRLRATGVEPGSMVGVVHGRSIDLVVALLAVMKCGGAYVAIDPGTPPDRLRAIVEDAGITRAVGERATSAGLAALDVEVVDVTAQETEPDVQLPEVHASAPMFVVFTSGSTGRPKGVPGSHRAVLNRCQWQFDSYPYASDEVACQKTTLDFVDHVAELWAPLVAGRPVVVISDAVVRVPDLLVSELARHRVKRIVLVPSMLRLLLEAVPDLGRRIPDLSLWMLSGESLQATLAQRLLETVPGATLVNVYGMSEAMADVTAHELESPTGLSAVPIGRPLHNQRVYVVDRVGRPTPVGVTGQIWVSGPAVAPGYLRQGKLTDAGFRANPFAGGEHGRVYVTGDIGRWRHDGVLDYLGRVDRQVKIRGVRVEPGEVEHAIAELTNVREVVVTIGRAGDQVDLVAFVVAGGGFEPTAARRALLGRLPDALIPSVIQQVDSMPKLPSGKIDIGALRAMSRTARPEPDQVVPFDDDVAFMIALWEEVIGTDGIGPDDEFFDVGGHSMAAMRVLARVLREHDVNMPLATFYSSPTPRALAEHLRRSLGPPVDEHRFRHLVPFTTAERPAGGTVFCVHGVGGNPLNFAELARLLQPEWHLVGVQARGVDGIGPLHTSIDELCDAYVDEILACEADGPYFLAGYSSGGIFAFEMATRLAASGYDVGGVALLDTFHPDVGGRARRPRAHLDALLRKGPAYVGERRRARSAVRRYAEIDASIAAHTSGEGVMPYELRERWIANGLRGILGDYSPPVYRGDVWLLSATMLDQRYEHVGTDRGWTSSAPRLDVVPIPGGHGDLMRAPNVDRVAIALRSRLEQAVRSRSVRSDVRSADQSPS